MRKKLVEKYLSELVRGLHKTISPQSHMDELYYFFNKNNRENFRQRYPHCFEALKFIDGRENSLLPLCNRSGSIDPKIIKLTIILIKKLRDEENEKLDNDHLNLMLDKLNKLVYKYSKDVVRPAKMAYRKGCTTKSLNRIKQHLDLIKNKVAGRLDD